MGQAGPHSLWYASRGGQQSGPFMMHELQDRFQSGAIARDDLVWCAEENEWRAAADVLAAPSPAGADVMRAPSADKAKRRSAAVTVPSLVAQGTPTQGAFEMKARITLPHKLKKAVVPAYVPPGKLEREQPAAAPAAQGQISGKVLLFLLLGLFITPLLPIFWFLAWRAFKAPGPAGRA